MSVRNTVIHMSLAAAVVGLASCDPSQEAQQRIEELTVAAAQKDSVVQELADMARFMSDINAELADVQLEGAQLVASESPIQASRESVLTKIRFLNERVDESATRLEDSRRRIRGLTRLSDSLRTSMEQTITNYERMLEANRETIASLTGQIGNLREENVRLAATVDTLAAAVDTLKAETSTVYYVIGTKDELVERGIVRKEGGARVLFIFGKRGETLVPARELDAADFTPIDKWTVTEIPLPDSTAEYTIASRQNLEFLVTPRDDKGRITGSENILIGTPEAFWMPSRFLIIVQG
jgi:hypothetical protein